MSERIRVDEDTCAALEPLKDDEETVDELFSRLRREREVVVDAGAGLWEGTDAAERARETHGNNNGDLGAR